MATSDMPAPAAGPGSSPPARAAGTAAGSAAPAGSAAASSAVKMTARTAVYVTRPTRMTLFLRTFLPWQLWRFARINLKMIRIIHRSRT